MTTSSTTEPTFDEVTLALLTESAKHYGGFIYPAIKDKRTGRIIDGHHRLEVTRRLEELGIPVTCAVKFEQTENDEEIEAMAIELNRVRRQWTDANQRRTQVQMLAATPIPGGRAGLDGPPTDKEARPPSQRQIAKALGVSRSTVDNDLKESARKKPDSETQSTTEGTLSPDCSPAVETVLTKKQLAVRRYNDTAKALRSRCKAAGISHIGGQSPSKCTNKTLEQALSQPSPTSQDNGKAISTIDSGSISDLPEAAPDPRDSIPFDDLDYATITAIDLERFLACPNTHDSVKDAFRLLYDAHIIIGRAFYGEHDWHGDDWVRINQKISAIRSITRQRAETYHSAMLAEHD